MAKSDEEVAQIDEAYEAERQAGPDFTRYHVGSQFVQAATCRLDRSDGARILHAFDVIYRGMFKSAKVMRGRPHGGPQIEQVAPPSRRYRDVLAILVRYAVRFGRVFPKLTTIAHDACVSLRTAQNALQWLRQHGFVFWVRRVVKERGGLGGVRSRQTSNAYVVGLFNARSRVAQLTMKRVAYAVGFQVARASGNTCHPSTPTPSLHLQPHPLRGHKGSSDENAARAKQKTRLTVTNVREKSKMSDATGVSITLPRETALDTRLSPEARAALVIGLAFPPGELPYPVHPRRCVSLTRPAVAIAA
jgi:hypothetical protein